MALANVPGLGGYEEQRRLNEQRPLAELQQVSGALSLLNALDAQRQSQQFRALMTDADGDPEKAMEAALRTGNVKAAHELAPLVKLAQEKKMREQTPGMLAEINRRFSAPAAAAPGPIAPDFPTANPEDAMVTQPAPAPSPETVAQLRKRRLDHLTALSQMPQYANNSIVSQRLQAEMDKLIEPKASPTRNRTDGENTVQEELQPDGTWREIGRGPRFARQVAPTVNVGGEQAPAVTDDTLAMDAWRYLTDGTLPPNMGRGVQGVAQATKIRNEASRLAKEMGMTPDEIRMAQLTNKTQVQAIGQLAKAKAQILQFEKTAEYNADLALAASKDVWRSGSPLLNKPIMWLRQNAAGDPAASKFNAAVETFVSEYARVMSGGYGAAQTTEGAQNRAHTLLSTAQSQQQFEGVIGQLRTEMNNRVRALNTQMDEERTNLRSGIRPGAQPKPTTPPTPAPVYPPGGDGWGIKPRPVLGNG